jgi:hypothetical protein
MLKNSTFNKVFMKQTYKTARYSYLTRRPHKNNTFNNKLHKKDIISFVTNLNQGLWQVWQAAMAAAGLPAFPYLVRAYLGCDNLRCFSKG